MPDKKDVAKKIEDRIKELLCLMTERPDTALSLEETSKRAEMGMRPVMENTFNSGLAALKKLFERQVKAQYSSHKIADNLVENVIKEGGEYTWDSPEMQYLTMWIDAGIDELQEIRGHLNWKSWKKPKVITSNDVLNARLELVDLLHFFINAYVMLGGSAESMIAEYHAKRDENDERQRVGY